MPIFYSMATCFAAQAKGWACWVGLPINLLLLPLLDTLLWKLRWKPARHLREFACSLQMMAVLCTANWIALLLAFHRVQDGVTVFEFLGLASTAGIMIGSSSLPAAHELVHRRGKADRAVGLAMLLSACYLHFRIEHVYGHHRNVATHDDPGTARAGEGFGAYLGRALFSGVASAWHLEKLKLIRAGSPTLSAKNRMLAYGVTSAAATAAIVYFFGTFAAAFWILQCFIAVHILEAANYAQHFGLSREKAGAQVAPIGAEHSWDCASPLAVLLLFGLPIHAQHHLDVRVSGAHLEPSASAPKMQISFYWMVFGALLPGALERLLKRQPTSENATQQRIAVTTVSKLE